MTSAFYSIQPSFYHVIKCFFHSIIIFVNDTDQTWWKIKPISHIAPLCAHTLFNLHNFASAAFEYMQLREKGRGVCIYGENVHSYPLQYTELVHMQQICL